MLADWPNSTHAAIDIVNMSIFEALVRDGVSSLMDWMALAAGRELARDTGTWRERNRGKMSFC
jgi:hypothetical protein